MSTIIRFCNLIIATLVFVSTVKGQYIDTVVRYKLYDYYNHELKYVNPKKSGFHFIEVSMKTKDSTWHVKTYHESNKSLLLETIFLDDSFKVADGEFLYYHYNGVLGMEGINANGFRVGLWKRYDANGLLIDSSRFRKQGTPYYKCYQWHYNGNLATFMDLDKKGNGYGYETSYFSTGQISEFGKYTYGLQKDSVWTYYDLSGAVCLLEYYDSGLLLKNECFKNKDNNSVCDTARHVTKPVKISEFTKTVTSDLHLPEAAKNDGFKSSVLVFVKFIVDEEGGIHSPEIYIGSHPAINEAALQFVEKMEKWEPTYYKGRPVCENYMLAIQFN